MNKKLVSWIQYLEQFSSRWWYFPIISMLAMLDLVILVIPTDALLVSSVMLQPKKWIQAFLWVSAGSALGCVLLQVVTNLVGPWVVGEWLHLDLNAQSFKDLEAFIVHWGKPSIALMALGPLPLAPAVLVAALGKMGVGAMFFWAFVGRALKYALFAWMATHAPGYLRKFWRIHDKVEEIQKN